LTRRISETCRLLGAVVLGTLGLACPSPPPPGSGAAEAAVAAALQTPAPGAGETECCLGEGDEREGELAPGGSWRFAVHLDEGELLEVVADQSGADLALTLTGPGDRRILRLDSPVGRKEPEDLVAVGAEAGTYVIEVKSLESARPGRFRVTVTALHPASPDDRERARAVACLAAAHELRRSGAYGDAALSYQRAAAAWGKLGDAGREADALEWAGKSLGRSGHESEAAELLSRSVEGFRGSGELAREARALDELGTTMRHLGRIQEATARYQEGLTLWRDLGNREHQARTLTEIANLHNGEDELGTAEVEYKHVLALWQSLGRRRDVAITRANLAGIYALAGQPKLALDLLSRSAAELASSGTPEDRAFVLEQIGVAQLVSGHYPAAIEAYRQALALLRQSPSSEGSVAVLDGLAHLHYEAGQYAEARKLYREALALPEARRDGRRTATLYETLAWTYLHEGQPSAALPLLRKALPALRQAGYTAGEAAALSGIARVERGLGHLEAAATWAERSLEAIEELRAGSDRVDLRSSLLATKQDAFDFAVDTLMELDRRHPGTGYASRAFDVSERARARSLLDVLGDPLGSGSALDGAGGDPRSDPLRQRVDAAEEERLRLLSAGADEATLARAGRVLRAALEDFRAARDRLPKTTRGAASTPRPLDLRQIQTSVLEPDTLLLSYDLGEEHSYLWAISRDHLATFTLPAAAVLEHQAGMVSNLLAHSDQRLSGEQVALQAAQLSDLLLRPAAGPIATHRRLLVSVEGALHTVPFGALPDPAGGGEPLLARHEIAYTPSASVSAWLGPRPFPGRSPGSGKLLAVLADPVFGPPDARLHSRPASQDQGDEAPRSARLAGRELPRLAASADEADGLVALVPPGDALEAKDFAARKELVTSGALSGYRILHFATHSWASAEEPELSALVLSRFDAAGHPRDGVLWAHEIGALHLSAELVVLSACDSGLGTAIHGEGLVGLSDAFFRAGAPRVVVSLWRVDDQAAAELMKAFYRGFLRDGLPVAEALRRAQLAIRAEPRWRRPYYWAGYVLEGVW